MKNGVWETYSSGTVGQSKVVTDLGVEVPELGELRRPDPDGVALEQQPDAALAAQQGERLPDDLVHAGDGPQGLQRGAIGRVLPGDAGDLGEGLARALGGQGRAHGRLGLGMRRPYG